MQLCHMSWHGELLYTVSPVECLLPSVLTHCGTSDTVTELCMAAMWLWIMGAGSFTRNRASKEPELQMEGKVNCVFYQIVI